MLILEGCEWALKPEKEDKIKKTKIDWVLKILILSGFATKIQLKLSI